MSIPDQIKGENRERDWEIVQDYLDQIRPEDIIVKRNLDISLRRVQQILYENREYINQNVAWDKSKRIWKAQLAAKDLVVTKKDLVEVLEYIRKETEGDSLKLSGDALRPIIQIIRYEPTENQDTSSRLPAEQVCVRHFDEQGQVQEHQLAQTGTENDAGVEQTDSRGV